MKESVRFVVTGKRMPITLKGVCLLVIFIGVLYLFAALTIITALYAIALAAIILVVNYVVQRVFDLIANRKNKITKL
ncbi:MAG: hypothetical protein EB060_00725 [Proteobacteria bacterium]|nr:hypothetical protein [Pseudomonadota bacterium]